MKRRVSTNLVLVLAIIALVAVPLVVYGSSASFKGSDDQGSSTVHAVDPHYKVWFHPLFEPSSSEVESGLFALQAGGGGVILGFVLGRLSARRRKDTTPTSTPGATP